MTWGAAAVIGGSTLVSGYMGSQASKKAGQLTADATRYATDVEKEMYDISREDLKPFRETGYMALQDIANLKPLFTSQFGPDQFSQYLDPSMDFRMKLGTQATERLGNVSGGAVSGNTLRALANYGQDLASTEYSNAFNRFQTNRGNIYNMLSNQAGIGQNAVNTGVGVNQATSQNIGTLAVGGAQAQGAGLVGAANAWSNALQGPSNFAQLYALGKAGFLKPGGIA